MSPTKRLDADRDERLDRVRADLRRRLIERRQELGWSRHSASLHMGQVDSFVRDMEVRREDMKLSTWQRWAWGLGLHLRVAYDVPYTLESDPYNEALANMYVNAAYGSDTFFAVERAMAIHTLTLARRSVKLPAATVGRYLGLHSSTISAWENGTTQDPLLHPLQRYAWVLGVGVQFLLNPKEEI